MRSASSSAGSRLSGALPLEPRFALAPDHPVDVAKMVVDDRIRRQKLGRALHRFDGLVEPAEPVVNPGKRVDDVARIGPCRDGAFDHVERLVEVSALFDH